MCVEPSDTLLREKAILPLSQCKACHQQKKQYTAYNNAAAHLRRAHFNLKSKGEKTSEPNDRRRRGYLPPMSELKNWMKEVDVVAQPSAPSQSSESGFEFFLGNSEEADDQFASPELLQSLNYRAATTSVVTSTLPTIQCHRTLRLLTQSLSTQCLSESLTDFTKQL
jgi:hypothetical protein